MAGNDIYNGKINDLLSCYWEEWGRCPDKATCESKGDCNDWDYSSWSGHNVCRVGFTESSEWGGPKSPCDRLDSALHFKRGLYLERTKVSLVLRPI